MEGKAADENQEERALGQSLQAGGGIVWGIAHGRRQARLALTSVKTHICSTVKWAMFRNHPLIMVMV